MICVTSPGLPALLCCFPSLLPMQLAPVWQAGGWTCLTAECVSRLLCNTVCDPKEDAFQHLGIKHQFVWAGDWALALHLLA